MMRVFRALAFASAALLAAVSFLGSTHAADLISPEPKLRFEDSNGNACSGCKLFTYAAGSTTKQATYTDSTGGTPNVNPIILDTRGEANVWLVPSQVYKYTLSPSTDSDPPTNPIWTVDQLQAPIGLTAIGNNQVLCNVSGVSAVPVGCSISSLTALLSTCTATVGGIVPTPPNNTTTYLRGDCTFATPNFFRRELTADTDYYVNASTGSDSNDCVTSGTACLTLQHVWLLLSQIDLLGHVATVHIADGSYAGLIAAGSVPGATLGPFNIIFLGNTSTPANVTVTGLNGISVSSGAQVTLRGMTLVGTGLVANNQGFGLVTTTGGVARFNNLRFGASNNAQIGANTSGVVLSEDSATYAISGSAKQHFQAAINGTIDVLGASVTLTGVPAYSSAFASVGDLGTVYAPSMIFTGTATGARFIASTNGVIDTGSGAGNVDNSYFPGNSAGSVQSGGQYN